MKPYRVVLQEEPFYRDFRTLAGAKRFARRAAKPVSILDRTGVPKYIAHIESEKGSVNCRTVESAGKEQR